MYIIIIYIYDNPINRPNITSTVKYLIISMKRVGIKKALKEFIIKK